MDQEIQLEDDTQEDINQDIPVYVTAVFIAVSGIGFLIFTVYYIAFLPVPTAMQPLRVRILTTLQLEEALEDDLDIVTITNAEDGLNVYSEPDDSSEVIAEVIEGAFYEKIEEQNGWVKVQDEDEILQGWIKEEHTKQIDEK